MTEEQEKKLSISRYEPRPLNESEDDLRWAVDWTKDPIKEAVLNIIDEVESTGELSYGTADTVIRDAVARCLHDILDTFVPGIEGGESYEDFLGGKLALRCPRTKGDVMAVDYFYDLVDEGGFTPDDGDGYLGTEHATTQQEVFSVNLLGSKKGREFLKSLGLTHVHWYNK